MNKHICGITIVAMLGAGSVALASDWTAGPSLLTARAGCAVAIDPSCRIITTGGRTTWSPGPDGTATNTVEVLDASVDPGSREWLSLKKPMNIRREFHAMVVVNGFAYVFGGSNSLPSGTVYYDSAERLDLLDPDAQWELIAPMSTARNICGAVVDDYGRIYIIGGENTPSVPLAVVDRYDPARDLWETMPPLNDARDRPGVAKDGWGRIYAIGGGINFAGLATVERFDPNHPEQGWQNVASIPDEFAPSQAVTACTGADGRIYLPGGIPAGGGPLTRCLRYDPKLDVWEPWVELPAALAADSNSSVMDCHGDIWLIGAHTGSPTAATYVLSGFCGAGDVRPDALDWDGDNDIDIDDLINVISRWGNCP